MKDLCRRQKEIACTYSTNMSLALSIEYDKICNSLKKRTSELYNAVDKINSFALKLDKKGKELVNENFLFCMLCRNRVWGLTKIVPDFATDYLTMSAYTEFLNTFESCSIENPELDVAVGEFISIMKEIP